MKSDAVISECKKYRYSLRRTWDESLASMVWVMLNPSTATATEDDHTIRKCIRFAQRWYRGQLIVVNLFARRTSEPSLLKLLPGDPIGPLNAQHFGAVVGGAFVRSELVVAAWGANGTLREDLDEVVATLRSVNAMCLGKTKSGQPRHPLRLSYNTPLEAL
jgi:hypothetical protein